MSAGTRRSAPASTCRGSPTGSRRTSTASQPPFTARFISGGRSNLTYQLVDAAGRAIVLRRPPLGHVLQSAHDMGREHRIIDALRDTDVPVANALGLCEDVAVNGAPFYLMDFVDGRRAGDVRRRRGLPGGVAPARPPTTSIDVMGRLHAVDPDAVGLGTLGRKEGYIARQLKRWHGQFEQSKTRELPLLDEVHDRLAARIPPQRWTGIVHGDFRLGNMILGPDGKLRPSSTGSWRRSATRSPTSAGCCRAGSRPASRRVARSRRRRPRPGSRRAPSSPTATPAPPAATCPTCRTTWRSPAGAAPASARAC